MGHSSDSEDSWQGLVDRYQEAIAAVEASDQPQSAQLLDILLARDAIASALQASPAPSGDELTQLDTLDVQVKSHPHWFNSIQPNVEHWHNLVGPDESAWWWPRPEPAKIPTWAQPSWLWSALTISFLTVSASLILNTTSRFWVGGIDSAGTLVIVAQSMLTLIVGKGALTESGRQAWGDLLKKRQVGDHQKQVWGTVGAGGVLVLTAGIHAALPWVAIAYNDWGETHYQDRRLDSAIGDFQTALSLRPDYPAAHFNLGLVYEDLQQLEAAKEQYQFVVQSDPDQVPVEIWLGAHNNLARLHVLSDDADLAAQLAIRAMDGLPAEQVDSQPEMADLNYVLYKNLGWVRLNQGRHREAQTYLESAIAADSERAAAYCLLAQVLDAQNQPKAAEANWQSCLIYANLGNPDEDSWVGIYEQRQEATETP